ncbi:MAG: hypothetical protein WAP35_01730 [Solirubrobacterales bacterium]
MRIDDLAFVRSGDKGDTSNVVLLARSEDAYATLEANLLPEAIASYMAGNVTGPVVVHKLPKLLAFNVVMHGALGGGATNTLRFDATGKSMCSVLSRMELPGAEQ